MELLVALVVTPTLVGVASLGAKRWGPSVGGWLLAFPVITAPLLLFLALSRGLTTCQQAAEGAVAGTVSIAGFCLVYSWLAVAGRSWLSSLLGGCVSFLALCVPMIQLVVLPVGLLFGCVVLVLGLGLRLMPALTASGPPQPKLPWDIPLRMLLGAVVVLAVELAVPFLGSGASGILSMIPVTTSIVSVFAHRTDGAYAVVGIQRGLLMGLFGTAAFSTTMSLLVDGAGPLIAFVAAVVVVGLFQTISLMVIRYNRKRPDSPMAPRSILGRELRSPESR
jgi:hypothetical protein